MEKITILGVRVDCLSPQDIEKRCEQWLINSQEFHRIVTVNPEFVMEARRNSEFRSVLNDASLATADGIGLVFASLYVYGKRIRRFTGVDVTLLLAKLCFAKGKSLYLLGANTGVAEKTADALLARYPRLIIAGAEEGVKKRTRVNEQWYGEDESANKISKEICQRITDCGADVLLVAFGSPKQELWIAAHAKYLPTVRIAVGVGGTFDYLCERVPRAPRVLRAIGLEWIYRLATQPNRWKRIVTAAIRFPFAVLFQK